MDDNSKPASAALGPTTQDAVVSYVKSLAGTIPILGPLIGPVIEQAIPNLRMQRLEDYCIHLEKRLSGIGTEALYDKFKLPENIDLFEEGALQAARSLSEARRERLAAITAAGISGEKKEQQEARRMLRIINDLGDDQIIILASYLHKNMHQTNPGFWEKHAEVLEPIAPSFESSDEELDKATLREEAKNHLVRLNLLKQRFKKPRKGELPEYDYKTGMMKASNKEITSLGRMVLKYAGLAEADDM